MEEAHSVLLELIARYTDKDWEDLLKRLRYYAYGRYGWLTSKAGGAVDLEDLIQESIADMIKGRRQWPLGLDVKIFLCQIIRSKVSHLLEKEGKAVPEPEHALVPCPVPGYTFHAKEDEQRVGLLSMSIRKLVADDELLSRIAEEWIREPSLRPREVASRLGLSSERMSNAHRRLKRRLASLLGR